jgi:O-acetyl-ADP-ribose deacetylase (regulator of RNase III)
MIENMSGDILKADAEALVNTVNCVGFMGRGIAAQFKRAFPENFTAYERQCKQGEMQPGKVFVFATGALTNPKFVINFPTKRHWRGKSRMEDIDAGLQDLLREVQRIGLKSIAIPPLGCGLGGLSWSDVRPRIEAAFAGLPEVRVLLFGPEGAPASERMAKSSKVPAMTPGRAVLVSLIERYLAGLMDPFVTLLEVHKLMYFMQEAGQPLRLRFTQAPYGPYAENLRHVLSEIEGHFISGYADGGDAPDKPIELVPGVMKDAQALLREHADVQRRFDHVTDLVAGFETPFGMELLATVHWIASRDRQLSDEAVIEATYAWNSRKRQFSPDQIELALRVLRDKGWIAAPTAPEAAHAS